ncbi:sensor histidine kinase [Actinophytocola sp.]|uniref:sensor histidine kinase n=1 Tax=Actinophytocola sp. TaxID=1872138 RepID=UPI00389A22A0
MSLGVLAVLGLLGGLGIDDRMPLWRVGAYLALAVLAYLHGRHATGRFGWQVLVGVGVGGCGVVAAVDLSQVTSALFILVISVVLPWLAGRYRRQQALLVVAERERARQLEREQEHVAERARLHERGRLAAELHDSLGHELALIALRAGALELSPDLRQEHRRAAGEMRASAVAATDRLRQTLEMLRDRDEAPAVEETVARARDAGMTVTLDGAAPLPDVVDQAIRRVVREALTNAARHAPGAPVTILITADNRQATTHITNPATEPRTTGSGLVGLRERLRLLGGRLDTTYADGTFQLTAQVPIA